MSSGSHTPSIPNRIQRQLDPGSTVLQWQVSNLTVFAEALYEKYDAYVIDHPFIDDVLHIFDMKGMKIDLYPGDCLIIEDHPEGTSHLGVVRADKFGNFH